MGGSRAETPRTTTLLRTHTHTHTHTWVAMTAVCVALAPCPMPAWQPRCCVMRAWHCSAPAGTRRSLTPTRSSRCTSPARCRDYMVLADFIKYFQYVIYGLASFFFLYGILLLAEGFYTTSAVKQTFGEFRSTQCSRCLSLTFIIVTFVLAVIWLVVFAFAAIPVYFLYNMAETCHTVNILSETTTSLSQHGWVCVDARQFGLLPWSATPGKVCGMTMANICKTPEDGKLPPNSVPSY
ncbi:hypothetical protein AOLI_G00273470 [Acnodon oligacanthus]